MAHLSESGFTGFKDLQDYRCFLSGTVFRRLGRAKRNLTIGYQYPMVSKDRDREVAPTGECCHRLIVGNRSSLLQMMCLRFADEVCNLACLYFRLNLGLHG